LAGARIVVLGPQPPPIGGVSRYCAALVDVLREAGASVRLVDSHRGGTGSESSERWTDDAQLVLDNYQTFWRDWRWATRTVRAAGRRWVVVIHHGGFPAVVGSMSFPARFFLRRALRRAGGALCMGGEVLQAVRRLAPRARSERSMPLLSPIARQARIATPLRPPALDPRFRRVVMWSGGYQEHYGVADLVAAVPEIASRHEDVGFVMAFGTWAPQAGVRDRVAALVAALGAGRVVVLEDAAEAPRLLAGSSVYLRTSRLDSFCLAIWEARLTGVPVVASRIAGRPDGLVGYDPGDAAGLVEAVDRALGTLDPRTLERAGREAEQLAVDETRRTLRFLDGLLERSA
jgi:glycosyltransferase involved in cell wall biosynthesis